jgi:hypothetical protein
MKYLPLLWSNSRGSVAGTVYSQNRGGLYTRNRTKPSNPNTSPQQLARLGLKSCVAAWGTTLTQTQRNGWILYAQTNPITNRIGNTVILSGLAMFERINIPLVMAGGTGAMELTSPGAVSLLTPPTINGSTVVHKGTAFGGTGNIDFNVTFPSLPASGDYVFFYITTPCPVGAMAAYRNQRLVSASTVGALGTPATTMTFTLTDPFPPSRLLNSEFMLRGYWISGNNFSSDGFFTDYTAA